MKKYTPYFLVLLVVIILGILFYRWRAANRPTPQISPEGISVESLTEDETQSLVKGTQDYHEVSLESSSPEPVMGSVRYFIKDGQLKFSAITQLSPKENVDYVLWVRSLNSGEFKQVARLELVKGGMIGSGSLSAEALPLEVVVSTTQLPEEVLNQAVMTATIPAPEVNSGT